MNETGPADQTLARITELARQALQAQTTLARQSLELGRATLAGDVDRSTTSRAYVDAVSREGARYWREVGALGLDYAGELLALASRSAGRVISEATTAGAGARTQGPAPFARPRRHAYSNTGPADEPLPDRVPGGEVTGTEGTDARRAGVVLRGAAGQVAQATVPVANRHARARRVDLTPSDLLDPAGEVAAVLLRVDPDRVTIPAGGEYQVRVEADLTADLVRPGDRYTGTVEVTGGDEATLVVTVEVAD
jgi:hypothetical protein